MKSYRSTLGDMLRTYGERRRRAPLATSGRDAFRLKDDEKQNDQRVIGVTLRQRPTVSIGRGRSCS
jgi:hypothetical protein